MSSASTGHSEGSVATSPSRQPQTNEMVERIDSLVARNSRRWKLLIVSEGLGLLVSAVLGYLWTVFLVDNFFYLPMMGRVLASLALIAIVGGLLTWIIARWRRLDWPPRS